MKLHLVQLFMRSLAEPIAQCGTPPHAVQDLLRTCDFLASFGDVDIIQFTDILSQAKEYKRTQKLQIPPSLQIIWDCHERVRALKAQPVTDENREELVRQLQALPLSSLSDNHLFGLAVDCGFNVTKETEAVSKNDAASALSAIWQGITEQPPPKPPRSRPSTSRKATTPTKSAEEYAAEVNQLKADAKETSPDLLQDKLKAMNLKELKVDLLQQIAEKIELSIRPKPKKKVDWVIGIENVVLEAHSMQPKSAD